jgi:hypothetical protein
MFSAISSQLSARRIRPTVYILKLKAYSLSNEILRYARDDFLSAVAGVEQQQGLAYGLNVVNAQDLHALPGQGQAHADSAR